MIHRFSRYKWLFAVAGLLGGLFLFTVDSQPAAAAQNCTYTYSSDGKSIKRTACTVNLNNATFNEVPDAVQGDKAFQYQSGNCTHSIIIQDETKPSAGQLNISTGCQDFSQRGAITIDEYVQQSPEDILRASLKNLINEQCSNHPAGSVRDACYNSYYGWVDECNTIARNTAKTANGDKNDAYRNRFAKCMANRSDNKLSELEVYQALPNDIYDQLTTAQAGDPGETDKTCLSEGGDFAWLMCPGLAIVDGVVGWLAGEIEDQLEVNSDKYNSDGLVQTWRVMRNIALLLLVPMMLLMVIGTALEFGPFDAYTVKKALPRMLLAVMFITLSLPITQFFINISNVVGRGIEGIVLSASSTPESLLGLYGAGGEGAFSGMVLLGGAAGIATGAITLGVVGSLALVAFLALLIGFLVLTLRELLILVLMMIAPLAILVWIFPGSDKLWKIWKTTFIALLMMFPLIILLISSGKVFAGVIDDSQNEFVSLFLKIIAFVAPFFFIPATFKYGLGVFGNIAGVINDRSRGIFDRQKKFREGSRAKGRQKAMQGNRFAGGNDTNLRGRLNRAISGGMNAPGAIMDSGNVFSPGNWRSSVNSRRGANTMDEIQRNLKENKMYEPWKYDDDMNRAASESHDEQSLRAALTRVDQREATQAAAEGRAANLRFSSPDEMNQAVSRVQAVRRSMGADAFRQMTTVQGIAGGTAYTAGEAVAAVAAAGMNDDAATASLVNMARKGSTDAGRADIGAAGFGTWLGSVREAQDEMRRTGGISQATVTRLNNQVVDSSRESLMAGQAIYGKPGSAEQIASSHARNIQGLVTDMHAGTLRSIDGSAPRQVVQEDIDRSLASVLALHDTVGNAAPQNARRFATGLMEAQVTDPTSGEQISVFEFAQGSASREAVQRMRRDYSARYTTEAQTVQGASNVAAGLPADATYNPNQGRQAPSREEIAERVRQSQEAARQAREGERPGPQGPL